jgi:hypothetical protein
MRVALVSCRCRSGFSADLDAAFALAWPCALAPAAIIDQAAANKARSDSQVGVRCVMIHEDAPQHQASIIFGLISPAPSSNWTIALTRPADVVR